MARLYMQGLGRVPNISDYGSKRLNNAWICLNVPHYALTWLNIPECPWMYEHPWIGLNKLFWLCQGSKYAARYSYNNVIIFVNKVARLEFLSATILSFLTQVRSSEQPKLVNFWCTFLFHYNNVTTFEAFKWTTGCFLKCEKIRNSKFEVS